MFTIGGAQETTPRSTTRKPFTTTNRQFTTTRKPYTTTRKPYTTTRRPYTTTQKPHTTSKPSTSTWWWTPPPPSSTTPWWVPQSSTLRSTPSRPITSQDGDISCSIEGSTSASPNDCNKFRQCLTGSWIELQCPPGLHWNNEKGMCDWPNMAKCAFGRLYI